MAHERSRRGARGSAREHEVIYGVHPVEEALRGKRRLVKVLVKDTGRERARLAALAAERGVEIRAVSPRELDRLSAHANHQGVVAFIEPFRYADFDDWLAGLEGRPDVAVVLLDSLKDAGNLGAILRTAAAAGCAGVIIPQDRAAPVTAAVVRASAGAAERIPVCRVVNLVRAMESLKAAGFWIVGAAGDAEKSLWDIDVGGRTGFVFGDEERGLRRLVAENCDVLGSIPMPGGFESLNVSAAVAVFLFDAIRRKRI